jgi:hypothetical protein
MGFDVTAVDRKLVGNGVSGCHLFEDALPDTTLKTSNCNDCGSSAAAHRRGVQRLAQRYKDRNKPRGKRPKDRLFIRVVDNESGSPPSAPPVALLAGRRSGLAQASVMALCSASPSSAFGAFHGGFGGFHGGFGGGFHPGFGGFHPGFRPGFVGFHAGFHPFFPNRRFVFHRGFFRNGVFINGWWGPAVVTSAWWGGYDSCWAYRPTYDAAGNDLGYRYVNLCY